MFQVKQLCSTYILCTQCKMHRLSILSCDFNRTCRDCPEYSLHIHTSTQQRYCMLVLVSLCFVSELKPACYRSFRISFVPCFTHQPLSTATQVSYQSTCEAAEQSSVKWQSSLQPYLLAATAKPAQRFSL